LRSIKKTLINSLIFLLLYGFLSGYYLAYNDIIILLKKSLLFFISINNWWMIIYVIDNEMEQNNNEFSIINGIYNFNI